MSAGVSVCLIVNLISQDGTQELEKQRDALRFKMLDKRIVQVIQNVPMSAMMSGDKLQAFVPQDAMFSSGANTNSAIKGPLFVTVTSPQQSSAMSYFIALSSNTTQQINVLINEDNSLARRIWRRTQFAYILLLVAFILNAVAMYYGIKIVSLYKT